MPFGNDPLQWSELIVERRATPVALDDGAFRTWMTGRRVFVSSTMDDEMAEARRAVRAWLSRWGAVPVMWEAITPRDQRPEGAYLEGVESRALFVLLLGSRYGVPDESGYSPTHKEANRAREHQLPRLLFVHAGLAGADRAGRLNDWLRELYNELSGAEYRDPQDLCAQLEERLREIAGAQESLWLKLGPLVFPGRVRERRSAGVAVLTVTARVRDGAVRRTLSSLGGFGGAIRSDRLTWIDRTEPVAVCEVQAETGRSSESGVSITCTRSREGRCGSPMPITYSAHGRSYGPAEQAELWARRAVFDEGQTDRSARRGFDVISQITVHDGPALPEILRTHRAQAWLAQGLTRLFLVEHLITKYVGHFDRLDVGPATSSGVRVDARFVIDSAVATISGVVPLR